VSFRYDGFRRNDAATSSACLDAAAVAGSSTISVFVKLV